MNRENTPPSSDQEPKDSSGLLIFFFVLIALALVRVLLGFVSVPQNLVSAGEVLSTVVFIGAPIYALYFAGRYEWTVTRDIVFIVIGLAIHFGLGPGIGGAVFHGNGFA